MQLDVFLFIIELFTWYFPFKCSKYTHIEGDQAYIRHLLDMSTFNATHRRRGTAACRDTLRAGERPRRWVCPELLLEQLEN